MLPKKNNPSMFNERIFQTGAAMPAEYLHIWNIKYHFKSAV